MPKQDYPINSHRGATDLELINLLVGAIMMSDPAYYSKPENTADRLTKFLQLACPACSDNLAKIMHDLLIPPIH